MNTHFFSSSDTSIQDHERCPEAELLKKYLQDNLPEDSIKFRMFLDINGNSTKASIFAQAPVDPDENLANYVKEFT